MLLIVATTVLLWLSADTFALFRDTLRFSCSWVGPGVDQGWVCGDNMPYVGAAIGLGGMAVAILASGLVFALARRWLTRTLVFSALAAVSLTWIGGWSFYAATAGSGAWPEGESGLQAWADAVVPTLVLCGVGLAIGTAGAVSFRWWAVSALWIGVVLMIVGTAVQPGLAPGTIVAAAMLAVAAVQHPNVIAKHRTSLE